MGALKGVPKARPDDGRTNMVMNVRIKPETLTRVNELAAKHRLSRAAMVGSLIERGLEAEEAKA